MGFRRNSWTGEWLGCICVLSGCLLLLKGFTQHRALQSKERLMQKEKVYTPLVKSIIDHVRVHVCTGSPSVALPV